MKGSISVIIPTLHEEGTINTTIGHIRSVEENSDIEIIVVDGERKGSTLRAISDDRVRRMTSKVGRGTQMNHGARASGGDILLFLHADTLLPGNWTLRIREVMSDGRFSGGAFKLRFDRISPVIGMFYFVHDIRGSITRVPYGDQGIFLRREVFNELGGFKDIPLFEDVDLMTRMRKNGFRIKLLGDKVLTSGRRFNEKGPIKTIIGNMLLIARYHIGADPVKLHSKYYGHRE